MTARDAEKKIPESNGHGLSGSEARRPGDHRSEAEEPAGVAGGPVGKTVAFEDNRRNYWIILGLAVAASAFFRLAFLAADPPWEFTWSQDLFTDGARVVDAARNKLLFGHWIIDRRSPLFLFYPISSLIAWVVFKIAGVGLLQANLTGALPALASLGLIYLVMRKLEGNLAGFIGAVVLGFSYVHVIFSRVALVETLLVLMLLGSFWLAFGGRRALFLSGLLVGLASFMVKMHALHFVPIVLVFMLIGSPQGRHDGARRSHLILSFLGGLGVAVGLWLATVYVEHPAVVAKYFKSNILLSQSADYRDLSLRDALVRRLDGLMHVGSGRDGYFGKMPELSLLAFVGLLGVMSRFSFKKPTAARWEVLAGIWFVGLCFAMSLLGYRPLRYLVLLTPSVCLLASSLLLRLARGEPILGSPRPRWFIWAFGVWLASLLLHFQQDVAFTMMTGGKNVLIGALSDFQQALYDYQFATTLQLLIFGGASFVVTFFFKKRIVAAVTSLSSRTARRIFWACIIAVVAFNSARFVRYAVHREYSIIETAQSIKRVLSGNVFLVGDCATTVALETDFKTLPAYGDLMRYKETSEFEQYPITHFLMRFPTLYEYLTQNYPDFSTQAAPIRLFGLCGREATLLRFEQWPGYAKSGYRPSQYEQAIDLMNAGQTEGAEAIFGGLVRQKPDFYEALWGLSVCQFQMREDLQAKATAERALEVTKRDALSYELYGDILSASGERYLAQGAFERARRLNPDSRRLLRKLGYEGSEAND